jgi:hypothetical protein
LLGDVIHGRLVDGAVLAGRTRRDGHELIEREDPGLAAFPSYAAEIKLVGSRTWEDSAAAAAAYEGDVPFWPSWKTGGLQQDVT